MHKKNAKRDEIKNVGAETRKKRRGGSEGLCPKGGTRRVGAQRGGGPSSATRTVRAGKVGARKGSGPEGVGHPTGEGSRMGGAPAAPQAGRGFTRQRAQTCTF